MDATKGPFDMRNTKHTIKLTVETTEPMSKAECADMIRELALQGDGYNRGCGAHDVLEIREIKLLT